MRKILLCFALVFSLVLVGAQMVQAFSGSNYFGFDTFQYNGSLNTGIWTGIHDSCISQSTCFSMTGSYNVSGASILTTYDADCVAVDLNNCSAGNAGARFIATDSGNWNTGFQAEARWVITPFDTGLGRCLDWATILPGWHLHDILRVTDTQNGLADFAIYQNEVITTSCFFVYHFYYEYFDTSGVFHSTDAFQQCGNVLNGYTVMTIDISSNSVTYKASNPGGTNCSINQANELIGAESGSVTITGSMDFYKDNASVLDYVYIADNNPSGGCSPTGLSSCQ